MTGDLGNKTQISGIQNYHQLAAGDYLEESG
jgi:hypothetical protein